MAEEEKIEVLPEVDRFIEAQAKLEAFKEKHPKFFKELYELMNEYNESLEAGSMAARATQNTHGPFVREKLVTKYDAEKLYDALGLDGFLRHGGSVETVSKYTVDKQRFESLVAAGVIPKTLREDIVTVTPHYKKIEKLVV